MPSANVDAKDQYIVKPQGRRREALPTEPINIQPPKKNPPVPNPPSYSALIARAVVPMMTVGAIFVLIGSQNPASFMVLLPSIATGLVMGGLQWWHYRKSVQTYLAETSQREQEYQIYLRQKEDEIRGNSQRQSRILWEENPPVPEMIKRANKDKDQLWERLRSDDDFLALRIGTTEAPMCVAVHVPPFDETDPLHLKILELQRRYIQVPNIPFTTNLNGLGTIGLRGHTREVTLQVAYTLLAHLVTHHSPELVRVCVISHHGDAPRRWGWLRWLPHVGLLNQHDKEYSLSFMPETDDDVLVPISRRLRKRMDTYLDRSSAQYSDQTPHTLIIFDEVRELRRSQVVNLLLEFQPGKSENPLQTSAIFIGEVPPQVNVFIDVKERTLEYRERWLVDGNQVVKTCKPELTTGEQMEQLARRLAPLRLDGGYTFQVTSLPSNVRLVELLDATQPLTVDLANKYVDDYDPLEVMAFPIGINMDGRRQEIIMREGGQAGFGHHLMLAGGTGTGKSVTLLSIVLSLAANNPPSHLNFVFADFKAGPSELSRLRSLPHVVGYVDDLMDEENEAEIERFRLALEGEMVRRQRLFEKTPQTLGRQIQNIYEFNKACPGDPLPHLVLVIDEFANGMRINPAFKETVEKRIAPLGRALGVHLLLSTQKAIDFMSVRPHIEIRMSMKLNTVEESRQIFERDDAARKLTQAGQALIQVGDNQLFEMFQVARADIAFHEEGGDIELMDEFTIRRILPDGRAELIYHHEIGHNGNDENHLDVQLSEAEVLVEHIRLFCDGRYKKPGMICLPPLPEAANLPLGQLLAKVPSFCAWQKKGWDVSIKAEAQRLRVPLGILDMPLQQDQRPFILDLSANDGHFIIVGAAASGKGLAIRSVILALLQTHPPDELSIDILSRSQTLNLFETAPHCRAIIHPHETERLSRLLASLTKEQKNRSQLLRENNVDSMASLRGVRPDLSLPSLVVVFDDFSGFVADHYEHIESIEKLIATGKQVDIHFIFTVTSFRGTHSRILQNSLNRLALGIKSGAETLEVFGVRSQSLPEKLGRGYLMQDGELQMVQIASPSWEPVHQLPDSSLVNEIHMWLSAVNDVWVWPEGRQPLQPILELPSYLELGSLWQEYPLTPDTYKEAQTAVMGLDYDDLQPVRYNFNNLPPYNLVLGPAKSGKTDFLINLCLSTCLSLAPTQIEIFLFSTTSRSPLRYLRTLPHIQFANNIAQAKNLLARLYAVLERRLEEQQTFDETTLSGLTDITRIIPKRSLVLVDDVQTFNYDAEFNHLLDNCMDLGRRLGIFLFLADSSMNIERARQNFSSPIRYISDAAKFGNGVSFSLEPADLILLNSANKLNNTRIHHHHPLMGKGRAVLTNEGRPVFVQFARMGKQNISQAQYEVEIRQVVREISKPFNLIEEGEE